MVEIDPETRRVALETGIGPLIGTMREGETVPARGEVVAVELEFEMAGTTVKRVPGGARGRARVEEDRSILVGRVEAVEDEVTVVRLAPDCLVGLELESGRFAGGEALELSVEAAALWVSTLGGTASSTPEA